MVAELADAVVVGALAIEIDADRGFWHFVFLLAGVERAFEGFGRHVPAVRLGVDEDRDGFFVDYGICAPGKSQRRADYVVVLLDAEKSECYMDGGGA